MANPSTSAQSLLIAILAVDEYLVGDSRPQAVASTALPLRDSQRRWAYELGGLPFARAPRADVLNRALAV
jgi:hypothetical protein